MRLFIADIFREAKSRTMWYNFRVNKNRDLGIDVYMREFDLAWKYRSLLKYTECF